ncbi:MAG: hypothetical protein ABIJ09_26300 [Pseudomonadota bacterium]
MWIRSFGLAFGSTLQSLVVVSAVFFTGMALGSSLAARLSRRIRHPLRLYAVLEVSIGCWALLSFPLLEHSHVLYAVSTSLGPSAESWFEGAAAMLLLAPPALGMGMSLPLLVAGFDQDRTGRRTAALYAVNTAGAVLGTLITGMVLIALAGHLGALAVGCALDLAAAVLILLAQRGRAGNLSAPSLARASPVTATVPRAAMLLAAVLGFTGMGYEVLYFRTLHLVLMGTLETISTVLATYLLGLVVGSALYHRLSRHGRPSWTHIGYLILAQVALALITTTLMTVLGWWSLAVSDSGGLLALLQRVGLSSLVLLPVASLSGALFPAVVDACGDEGGGHLVGRLLASNTVGAVIGSLGVGAAMVPRLGTTASFYLVLLVALSTAVAIGLSATKRHLVVGALGLLGLASVAWPGVDLARLSLLRVVPRATLWRSLGALEQITDQTVFAAEGAHGTVTLVEEPPKTWTLYIDGLPQASRQLSRPRYSRESVLLGSIPAALARHRSRALVIGLGGGVTAEALVAAGVEQVDVVEIEPRVVEALRHVSDGVPPAEQLPGVRILQDDGRDLLQRNHYAAVPARYDVIASQPTHWWLSGVGNLATEEFYRLAQESLTEGGVYFQWINTQRMTEEVLRGVVHSMSAVFDEVVLLAAEQRGLFYLAGTRGALVLDADRVAHVLQRPELTALCGASPRTVEDLLALVVLSGAPPAGAVTPRNRDRDALIETHLAHVAADRYIDLSAMQPALLDRLGPAPGWLTGDESAFRAFLLSAAERRLMTPGGMPAWITGIPEEGLRRDAVWPSVTRLAVEAASGAVGPCMSHYLQARRLIVDGQIEEALLGLDRICRDQPDDEGAQRAARFAALLNLERRRCALGLEQVERIPTPRPEDLLLRGLLVACLGRDPEEFYRPALDRWSAPAPPGPAMRWAAERGHPILATLLARVRVEETMDPDALQAALLVGAKQADPSVLVQLARRWLQALAQRQQRLHHWAMQAEKAGDAGTVQRLNRAVLDMARDDLEATVHLVRSLHRAGDTTQASRVAAEFVQRAPDPDSARRLLLSEVLDDEAR